MSQWRNQRLATCVKALRDITLKIHELPLEDGERLGADTSWGRFSNVVRLYYFPCLATRVFDHDAWTSQLKLHNSSSLFEVYYSAQVLRLAYGYCSWCFM